MKAQLIVILTFFSALSYSQTVTFKEIKLRPDPNKLDSKDSTIIYPIVVAKSAAISNRINKELRKQVVDDHFIDEADSALNIKAALKKNIADGLVDLSYTIYYNSNYILSMEISGEGCGAYCDTYTQYFNFDLKTGRPLKITDVILANKLEAFKKLVAKDKVKYLKAYKKDQEQEFNDYVDENCINTVSIENFILTDKLIEIYDPCEFPHVIQSQEPMYDLEYSLKKIESYLKPEIKARLSGGAHPSVKN